MLQKIIPFIILVCIATTLLNSNLFGFDSLIAYFFYTFCVSLLGIIVFSSFIFSRKLINYKLPLHIVIFFSLTFYIYIHGYINNNVGLSHYYWITNTLFVLSIYYWILNHYNDVIFTSTTDFRFLLVGIIILAIIESIIIFLQILQIFPVPSQYFLCTGTWSNPNVIAMFLALSLFAVFQLKMSTLKTRSWITNTIFSIIIIAILALGSRSAYLAGGIIFIYQVGFKNIKGYFLNKNQPNRIFAFITIAFVLLIITSSFISKNVSSKNRIGIWENSIELIADKPLQGFGFGMFEKEYNLYTAQQKIINTEHINMPYNDFLELGVEGGIVAFILWVSFLICLWKYNSTNFDFSILSIILAFTAIQLTNFGFKAIPAMVLFLVFISFTANKSTYKNNISTLRSPINLFITSFLIFCSFAYMFFVSNKIETFYDEWMIGKKNIDENTIISYQKLNSKMYNYAPYHENFGDAYQKLKNYKSALNQYLIALKTSSNPDLFLKTAYCYFRLGNYNYSEIYYQTAENIQPNKLISKFSLLKVYLHEKDTLKVIQQSKQILQTQSKINSNRAKEIKQYADSVNKKWSLLIN